jgi:hypothetical protein
MVEIVARVLFRAESGVLGRLATAEPSWELICEIVC